MTIKAPNSLKYINGLSPSLSDRLRAAAISNNRVPRIDAEAILPSCARPRPSAPFVNRAQGRRFAAADQGDVAEIDLFDEIGDWGVTASAFKSALARVGTSRLRVNLNSPGGDVFDGIAIMNALVQHPAQVEINVLGLAASAASIVAMAGDRVVMADNAFMMIHNTWVIAMGDRNALMDMSNTMAKLDDALARTYAHRTGLDVAEAQAMMDAESWLSAADAVDQGFADDVADAPVGPQALFDLSAFHNKPAALPAIAEDTTAGKPTRRDMERGLQSAGLTRSQARKILSAAPLSDVTQDADATPADVTQDADRAGLTAALGQLLQTLNGATEND